MKILSLSLLAAAILAMATGMAEKSSSPYGDTNVDEYVGRGIHPDWATDSRQKE